MQISRHWRLNAQRYRLQGERAIYIEDGEVIGMKVSLEHGKNFDISMLNKDKALSSQKNLISVALLTV